MEFRPKKIWLFTHRWLGLTVGLHIVLLGLTGSFLVFHREIDRFFNPWIYGRCEGSPRIDTDDALRRLEAAYGGKAPYTYVFVRRDPHDPIRFEREISSGDLELSSISPVTGRFLGHRIFSEFFTSFVYELHYELFLGEFGQRAVGITGLVFLLLMGSGLYLAWPMRRSELFSLAFRSHRLTGVCSVAILVWLALSGVCMVFLGSGAPVAPLRPAFQDSRVAFRSISIEEAIRRAKETEPSATLTGILVPARQGDPYRVGFREPGAIGTRVTTSYLWVDQRSGQIIGRNPYAALPWGSRFLLWQRPIHTGEIFGIVGRVLVFLAGLIPLILYVTGVWIWLGYEF